MKTTQPRKQRKRLYQAPLHERHRRFASHLSPELKKSHNTRTVPVRRGDTVQIMRGDFKGYEGKVAKVNRKNYRITVEGVTREKVDGTSVSVPIHPSKVMITSLNLDDEWRKEALKRKGAEKEAKPPEEEKPKPPERKRKRRKRESKASMKPGGA